MYQSPIHIAHIRQQDMPVITASDSRRRLHFKTTKSIQSHFETTSKAAAAAKAAVGGTKMWKSAFKVTVHDGVAEEGL